ncbi:ATP-grasp domain-containing protein [Parageobacillus thermoglucosidasius]|jgi:biotin carboxylase|uniref:ATP-grasp domain-containing protein n=1 Tax=Parageobacillus thermoglucosidasius TaxID=1426 RepID=A0A1B7KVH9_PARTM|nr:ATP-grasp domain-containing protein [Parageobacillus thermoglucosidasius]OAT74099.1 hypothetical protein A7K69_16190 [Parageobacillus thermoglucosidasius]
MNVLLVGFNKSWAEALEREDVNVFVIEERDIWVKKNLSVKNYTNIKDVAFFEYQQKTNFEQLISYANSKDINVVIPGLEYSVLAATTIASNLRLPNIGLKAAKILTNKFLLRSSLKKTNIPQPRYQKISSLDDIKNFYKTPIVIKPINRQASAGVVKVYHYDDIEWAWRESQKADEGIHVVDRELSWEYMVEELLEGQEISTEVLVHKGEIEFFNITVKQTADGNFPVELGHYVPGTDIPNTVQKRLHTYIKMLIEAIEVETGILHAEWIIVEDTPYIIECAGRAPGDLIFTMVRESYNFCPYKATLNLLANNKPDINNIPSNGAGIAYLYSYKSGILESINGIEKLKKGVDDVLDFALFINTGDKINELKSSWDRIGFVLCKGIDGVTAFRKAKEKVNELQIKIVQEMNLHES